MKPLALARALARARARARVPEAWRTESRPATRRYLSELQRKAKLRRLGHFQGAYQGGRDTDDLLVKQRHCGPHNRLDCAEKVGVGWAEAGGGEEGTAVARVAGAAPGAGAL